MPRIRILIADDHAILRAGLRMMLAAQPDFEVVGEAADGAETLAAARASRPDVVLLDFTMPGSRGTETIERLAALQPAPRVLVLTMHDDRAYAEAAVAAGAAGYIVKKSADVELLGALRTVHHGRTVVDQTRRSATASGAARAGRVTPPGTMHRDLSARETEVIRLLAAGNSNREAAVYLGVSVKTVETYRARLADKLGLKGRAQLFRYAAESGLLSRDTLAPD